jgi:hypothetical protein
VRKKDYQVVILVLCEVFGESNLPASSGGQATNAEGAIEARDEPKRPAGQGDEDGEENSPRNPARNPARNGQGTRRITLLRTTDSTKYNPMPELLHPARRNP